MRTSSKLKPCILTAAVFSVLLLTVPALPLLLDKKPPTSPTLSESSQIPDSSTDDSKDKENTDTHREMLKVLDVTTGKVEEISAYDYVVGAVCAQMPATFEQEALKAQAVAAYTYAVRRREKAKTAPDKELGGAYFSNDNSKYQGYFTEEQARHYYGENYDMYMENIKKAVDAVMGEYISYDGEPIIAAFHALSPGKTESAENVWGSSIPYLVSCDSSFDTSAPKFEQEHEFTAAEVKRAIEKLNENIKLDEKTPEKWFGEPETGESGTVLTIDVGGISLTGQQVRSALSLPSAAFEIKYDDGFLITTKGCGHAVGMSQFGANELAKSGKTYKEILEYYDKGILLEKDTS